SDLARRSFLIWADRCKGKDAASAYSQHTTNDSLLAHAQADQRVLIAPFLQKLHHGHVVVKSCCRTHEFVIVGGDGDHFVQRFFQTLGSTKVVVGEDQRGSIPQALQVLGVSFVWGLWLECEAG